jgi:hypothetical protein
MNKGFHLPPIWLPHYLKHHRVSWLRDLPVVVAGAMPERVESKPCANIRKKEKQVVKKK